MKKHRSEYWDKRAGKLDNLTWVNDDALLTGIIKAAHPIRPNTRLIDIGTGTGKVLKGFYELYPQMELSGIDICPEMIGKIDSSYPFKLYQCDVYDMKPMNESYYDIVTARMVFHHLFEPQRAMNEIKRILAPGGKCIICEGNPPDILSRHWYTEMFKYKEDRITLMESDLINIFLNAYMEDIISYTIVLRQMSMMNWLNNSTTNGSDYSIIVDMHRNAPQHVKDAYHMTITPDDILMDWKFTVVSGIKPSVTNQSI